ncbi:hypothetical protein QFC22_005438 [Naganishia vaughanmartiniae]|uniref:Uncharacterized protein n=1 Tax=Naganishia vaughanmartiniae TaxID=1424756 RepID=A0ACC2WUD0_9TREE|nr:hypothetical protein QFC22_005438 [Naganishia vaughanmartiniae]
MAVNPTEIWENFIDGLRQVPKTDLDRLGRLNEAYAALETVPRTEAEADKRIALLKEFEDEKQTSETQARLFVRAKEQLEQMLLLSQNPPPPAPPPAEITKRKRRVSPPSGRLSPAVGGSSSAPIVGSGRSTSPLPSTLSAGPHGFSHQRDSGTPTSNRQKEARARKKDMIQAQLPLQRGRRVAFKMSSRAAGNPIVPELDITGEASETGWILAEIEGNIGADRNRKIKFNTTMRAIFPLPDLHADPSSPTHPNKYEDFPAGTRVLAIYPDTSSFYRGVVVHPPVPGTASGHPVAKATSGSVPGKYIVEFDDDNNQQQQVNWDLVFEVGELKVLR